MGDRKRQRSDDELEAAGECEESDTAHQSVSDAVAASVVPAAEPLSAKAQDPEMGAVVSAASENLQPSAPSVAAEPEAACEQAAFAMSHPFQGCSMRGFSTEPSFLDLTSSAVLESPALMPTVAHSFMATVVDELPSLSDEPR